MPAFRVLYDWELDGAVHDVSRESSPAPEPLTFCRTNEMYLLFVVAVFLLPGKMRSRRRRRVLKLRSKEKKVIRSYTERVRTRRRRGRDSGLVSLVP